MGKNKLPRYTNKMIKETEELRNFLLSINGMLRVGEDKTELFNILEMYEDLGTKDTWKYISLERLFNNIEVDWRVRVSIEDGILRTRSVARKEWRKEVDDFWLPIMNAVEGTVFGPLSEKDKKAYKKDFEAMKGKAIDEHLKECGLLVNDILFSNKEAAAEYQSGRDAAATMREFS